MLIQRGKTEGWLHLDVDQTKEWAKLSGISFSAASAKSIPGRGLGLTADRDLKAPEEVLSVPEDLVLSLDTIKQHAQFDSDFRELFESLGASATSPRMAILSFLLFQATVSCPDLTVKVGVHSPFTDYVKTLPCELLPTFWSANELQLLIGTTLAPAVSSKLRSLRREYDLFCSCAANTRWSRTVQPYIELDDWMQVDAMFRSRALDFHGQCMIPGIDLCSHAAGEATNTFYDRQNGSYVLMLMEGKEVKKNEEITITYGDEKGACEMLFSYGFIDNDMDSAETLFLNLTIPEDDILRTAKMEIAQCAPGFKLIDIPAESESIDLQEQDASNDATASPGCNNVTGEGEIDWTGDFIWLLCVGPDDGFEFRLARTVDDQDDEVEAEFNGEVVKSASDLRRLLAQSPLWEMYRLRAVVLLQQRVFDQMQVLDSTQEDVENILHGDDSAIRDQQFNLAMQLRRLEFELLGKAYESLETQKITLAESEVVQGYLAGT